MLLQEAASAGAAFHPLVLTPARWMWLLPLLPLLGFVLNGALSLIPAYTPGPADPQRSHGDDAHEQHEETDDAEDPAGAAAAHHHVVRHRFATLTSIIGPGVMVLAFALAATIFFAMRDAGELHAPFVQRYFTWIIAGDLKIDAAFQLDQLSMVMILVI